MRAFILLPFTLLAGCAGLPEATGQLRITEHGESGRYVPFVGLEVGGCIASVVGELPAGLEVIYDGQRCIVRYGP